MTRIVRVVPAIVASLGLVGAAWTGVSAVFFPLTSIDFDTGRQLFQKRCASCHSIDTAGKSSYGPGLERIGLLASQRVPGMSAEEYLLESILLPNAFRQKGEQGVMPADISSGLSPQEVLSLVGYLATHGGSPDYTRLMSLSSKVHAGKLDEHPEVDFAAAEAGKELYVGKGGCIKCHPLRALPGFALQAPSLLGAGKHERSYLLESICEPSKTITSGYDVWNAHLASGKVYTGRLLRRSDDSIDLFVEESGVSRMVTLPIAEIDVDDMGNLMLHRSKQSAMPDVRMTLSIAEIELIVEFLSTLR